MLHYNSAVRSHQAVETTGSPLPQEARKAGPIARVPSIKIEPEQRKERRLFTGVRGREVLGTSSLRSSEKFACIGFSPVQSNHHEKAITSSCSFPGTCALALLFFLLGLSPLRSLQGTLEPRQSLVPHILLLASAKRREHLQRLYLVLLPAEPHPGPPIGSFEGEASSGGY